MSDAPDLAPTAGASSAAGPATSSAVRPVTSSAVRPVTSSAVRRVTSSAVSRVTGEAFSHATSKPDACSVLSEAADASAYGTAAGATFWLALEQDGPWGRQAATESHLDPVFGGALDLACAERGGRLILIRRPGEHPDSHGLTRHRCYLAWAGRDPFLLTAEIASPEELIGLDLEALSRGDRDGVSASLPLLEPADPVLLVCTNGRRDVCCAVRGRPIAAGDHTAYPGRVWECSHTGGHRYAPTGVLLPWGRALGRLDDPAARTLLDAADDGRLPPGLLGRRHDRGASALSPGEQAAESAVRAAIAETRLTALTAATSGEAGTVVVEHGDGRQWLVEVECCEGSPRPESCGKAPVASWTWSTTIHDAAARRC